MAESTLWWLLAGGIVAAELLTGTFYLLMLALGVAAAAIAAHLGMSTTLQIVTAAVVGGGSVIGLFALIWLAVMPWRPTSLRSPPHRLGCSAPKTADLSPELQRTRHGDRFQESAVAPAPLAAPAGQPANWDRRPVRRGPRIAAGAALRGPSSSPGSRSRARSNVFLLNRAHDFVVPTIPRSGRGGTSQAGTNEVRRS